MALDTCVNNRQPAPPLEPEDIAIEIPESTDFEYTTIPSGAYPFQLTKWETVEKPEWRVAQQQAAEDAKEPDKRKTVDPRQWRPAYM